MKAADIVFYTLVYALTYMGWLAGIVALLVKQKAKNCLGISIACFAGCWILLIFFLIFFPRFDWEVVTIEPALFLLSGIAIVKLYKKFKKNKIEFSLSSLLWIVVCGISILLIRMLPLFS